MKELQNGEVQLDHPELGEQLKQQGQQHVLAKQMLDDWKKGFAEKAMALLILGGNLTAEEVVAECGFPPGSHNAIAAAMSRFAKANKLRIKGYEKSKRKSRRAGIVVRWERTN